MAAQVIVNDKKRPRSADDDEEDEVLGDYRRAKQPCLNDATATSSHQRHLYGRPDGKEDECSTEAFEEDDDEEEDVVVDTSDPVQRHFIECLLSKQPDAPSILVTGGAGVGKTFLVKYARKLLIEDVISRLQRVEEEKFKALAKTIKDPGVLAQCESAHTNLLSSLRSAVEGGLPMTAYTAAAATLLDGGTTLHRFMGMGLMDNPDVKLKSEALQRLRLTRIVFVDEVSMLHPKQLMIMDAVLRRYLNPNQPFGGIRFVFIGDFAQLPPIPKNHDDMLKRNGGTYDVVPTVFDVLKQLLPRLKTFCFQRIFRQALDPDFGAALNRIRLQRPGALNREDAMILISRVMPLAEFCRRYRESEFGKHADERIMPTIICPRNKQVASHNRINLNKLDSDSFFFPARYIYTRWEWMLLQRTIADGSASRLLQSKQFTPFVYDTRERADITRTCKFKLPELFICVPSPTTTSSASNEGNNAVTSSWQGNKSSPFAKVKAAFDAEMADGDEEDTTMNPHLSKRTFWIDNSLAFGETYMSHTCAASLATPIGLHLKVGAQVTLTANIKPKSGLFNGQRGVVTHICTATEWARIRAEEAAIRAVEKAEREGRDSSTLKDNAMVDEDNYGDDDDDDSSTDDGSMWPVVKFVNGAHRIIRPHLFELEVPGLPTNQQRRTAVSAAVATSGNTAKTVDLTLDAMDDDEDVQLLGTSGSNANQPRALPSSLGNASNGAPMVAGDAKTQPRMYAWLVPLELAWSTTVHKAQGRTLTFMYIDIGPTSSYPLPQGLLFVALSRVQHREQFAISSFHVALNTTDPRVNDYYETLHAQQHGLVK